MKQGFLALLFATQLGLGPAYADQSLRTALHLDMAQASKVDAIEAKYRKPFAAKRQERNEVLRKARRARIANDAEGLARSEATAERLHEELRKTFRDKNEEIRAVLNESQRVKFEQVLKLNREMLGSSRDAKGM